MSQQFMIGADPEVFVRKNGKPISAFGLIEGTKKAPCKTDYGARQVDGMALEFNINPSDSGDFDTFNLNIVKALQDLRETSGANLYIEPVQEFDPAFLEAQPEEAKELGCDPDFNAYTLEENPRPDGDRPFRTGAGHIHVGWGADIPVENEEHVEICAGFIKMLDATVGMFMTLIDRDPRRRELYGKAGAFRPKPYGVEYRTPSNVWIKNKDRRLIVHALVRAAIYNMQNGVPIDKVTKGYNETDVQHIIDQGDFEQAWIIVDGLLNRRYGTPEHRLWQTIRKNLMTSSGTRVALTSSPSMTEAA